jgi:hypothetical protein
LIRKSGAKFRAKLVEIKNVRSASIDVGLIVFTALKN